MAENDSVDGSLLVIVDYGRLCRTHGRSSRVYHATVVDALERLQLLL